MAPPTPYPELNSVLEELVASVKAALGEAFVGAYLQGSFAVGDFDRHSDVDFIIVVSDEPGHDQVDALQAMHRRIYAQTVVKAHCTGEASLATRTAKRNGNERA